VPARVLLGRELRFYVKSSNIEYYSLIMISGRRLLPGESRRGCGLNGRRDKGVMGVIISSDSSLYA
jgi:hypothetical protein